jgi:hypothetical protein
MRRMSLARILLSKRHATPLVFLLAPTLPVLGL